MWLWKRNSKTLPEKLLQRYKLCHFLKFILIFNLLIYTHFQPLSNTHFRDCIHNCSSKKGVSCSIGNATQLQKTIVLIVYIGPEPILFYTKFVHISRKKCLFNLTSDSDFKNTSSKNQTKIVSDEPACIFQ